MLKYTHESKLNNVAIPVPKGTVSIILNTEKKNPNFSLGQKLSPGAKFKLKWKTIQWLMLNKREGVEFMVKEKTAIWDRFCVVWDNHKLKKNEFKDLLVFAGLGSDEVMADKLF